jgi:hypothetical protein
MYDSNKRTNMIPSTRTSTSRSHWRRGFARIGLAVALACFGLSPRAHAVTPPPGGDYAGDNTAEGRDALFNLNTSFGFDNVANGAQALFSNTKGNGNIASGAFALFSNTTGNFNTANGFSSLFLNSIGSYNLATGKEALYSNNDGINNIATGGQTLFANTSGNYNIAIGHRALFANITGSNNIALGSDSSVKVTGSNNIALGSNAGTNLTTGNDNIDIGNAGVAGESNKIRIGSKQDGAFIAGIYGHQVTNGMTVLVDSLGRLGTQPILQRPTQLPLPTSRPAPPSSARFKEQIKPMDKVSEAILALKPVMFRFKHEIDLDGIPQFGLVAEQVEKVNPDLVTRDEQGKPYRVRYAAVNAMLLNEFLKEHREVEEQGRREQKLEATVAQQQKDIQSLTAQIHKVSDQLEVSKVAPQVVANDQ